MLCVLSGVGMMWITHRGGLVPGVYTEWSEGPLVTLNLCVVIMGLYLSTGEGDLVPTNMLFSTAVAVIGAFADICLDGSRARTGH